MANRTVCRANLRKEKSVVTSNVFHMKLTSLHTLKVEHVYLITKTDMLNEQEQFVYKCIG